MCTLIHDVPSFPKHRVTFERSVADGPSGVVVVIQYDAHAMSPDAETLMLSTAHSNEFASILVAISDRIAFSLLETNFSDSDGKGFSASGRGGWGGIDDITGDGAALDGDADPVTRACESDIICSIENDCIEPPLGSSSL